MVFWAAAIFCASAALRGIWLCRSSLWFDEVCSLMIARARMSELVPLAILVDANSFLFNVMLYAWIRVVGEGLLALRILPFVTGLAALGVYLQLCREELGPDAFFPMLLGGLSYLWFYHGIELRPYSLFLFFSVASTLLFRRMERDGETRRAAALYALSVIGGLYTYLYFLFIVLGHALWLLFRRRSVRLLSIQALSVALFLPWLQMCLHRRTLYFFDRVPLRWDTFLESLGTVMVGSGLLKIVAPLWITAAGAVAAAFICAAAWRAFRRGRSAAQFYAVLIFSTLASAVGAGWLLDHPHLQGRYLLGISPFVFLLIGLDLRELPIRSLAHGLFAAVMLAGTVVQLALRSYADPRFAQTAESIRRAVPPDTWVVHTTPYWYLPLSRYYSRDRDHFLLVEESHPDDFLCDPLLHNRIVHSLQDPLLRGRALLIVDPSHKLSDRTFVLRPAGSPS